METKISDISDKKRFILKIAIIFILLGAVVCAYVWLSKTHPAKQVGPLKKITLADGATPNSFQIYVALAQGYFREEGLDLSFSSYASGKEALLATIDGKAQLATVADTPIMFSVMNGAKIYVLATLYDSYKSLAIVAKKERGISRPTDLLGKKIGVLRGSSSEFFMETFFLKHGIRKDELKVVYYKGDQTVDALKKNEVDAISIWAPYTIQLQRELGSQGLFWFSEGIYKTTWNIISPRDVVDKDPEIIQRLLRGLLKADNFIGKDPDTARQRVADYLKMDKTQLDELWNSCYVKVKLDQNLLIDLEDQARWAIKEKLTNATKVPNFLDILYLQGLKTVSPEAISLGQ